MNFGHSQQTLYLTIQSDPSLDDKYILDFLPLVSTGSGPYPISFRPLHQGLNCFHYLPVPFSPVNPSYCHWVTTKSYQKLLNLSAVKMFGTSSYLHDKVQTLQRQAYLPSLVSCPSFLNSSHPSSIDMLMILCFSVHIILQILFLPTASAFSLHAPFFTHVTQMSLLLWSLLSVSHTT